MNLHDRGGRRCLDADRYCHPEDGTASRHPTARAGLRSLLSAPSVGLAVEDEAIPKLTPGTDPAAHDRGAQNAEARRGRARQPWMLILEDVHWIDVGSEVG